LRRELSLKEVVHVLQNTYRGIDIRAAIGRQKGKDEWTCIFLKIRATIDTRSVIESIFEKKLAELAIQQKENFRFLAEYRTITELESIINEMKTGKITINEVSSVITSQQAEHLSDLKIQKYPSYLTDTEINSSGYNHWFVFGSNKNSISPYQTIVNLGLTEDDLGIKFSLICQWFDVSFLNGNVNNFVLLFPVYVKRYKIESLEGETIAKYSIHKFLLNRCSYRKTIYNTEILSSQERLNTIAERVSDNVEMVKLNLSIQTEQISKNSRVEFEVLDNTLGNLFSDNLVYEQLIPPPVLQNHLKKLISDGVTQFSKYSNCDKFPLENYPKVNPLETYVYYLFSQLFQCVWVGLFENIWRNIFLGKEDPSYTVDFILFDTESVTLVECTRQFMSDRSILGEYEVGKLTNAKAILERYGHKVNAILVCGEPYANNPRLFNRVIFNFNEVYFMFKEDLDKRFTYC
jgi:hypothetical protein